MLLKESYERLFINNRNWVKKCLDQDPDYFKKMSIGQTPNYLFIGCSDSRVPANEITGTRSGEMFVHRNIANVVVHTDMNVMSVLQYSVQILKVKHIIVCGHYGCGGIKAAAENQYHGLMDQWLRNIKDVYRLYKEELASIIDEDERHRRMVELNVREQVYHLCMTQIVQEAMREGRLQVHGWVYDIHDGLIRDLEIDVSQDFSEIELYKYAY